jgi:hypothetical protein
MMALCPQGVGNGYGPQGVDGDLQLRFLTLRMAAVEIGGGGGWRDYIMMMKKNPCEPAQPAPRVRVFGGWENSNPHPYPRQPVPATRTGYITRDFPYVQVVSDIFSQNFMTFTYFCSRGKACFHRQ